MSHWRSDEPRQKKSLGQVFLNTTWPVDKVVERVRDWGAKRVIEIGPGAGILTRGLFESGLAVTAVEKDDRFAERLQSSEWQASRGGSLAVINTDVLQFDLGAWLDQSDVPAAVVGNIPYNVSTPILMWVLPHMHRLLGVNFLVQLEFGARLAAPPGGKSYGSLSVFTQLRALTAVDCKVDKECFTPVPKVDSALVSLVPLPNMLPAASLQRVESVARSAFTQRRKKLRNAIKGFVGSEREPDCPIDLNRRPETLSPEEFVTLAEFIFKDKLNTE